MTNPTFDLTNQLLIAMPHMHDAFFNETVILICDHNEQGAMGLVINQPIQLKLSKILQELKFTPHQNFQEATVFLGGPVQSQMGLVLHPPLGKWKSSFKLSEEAALTSSLDILEALSRGDAPKNALLMMGYAGWGPGQLEQELASNAWLTAPATQQLIFNTPTPQKWRIAAKSIGVDLDKISSQVGHA